MSPDRVGRTGIVPKWVELATFKLTLCNAKSIRLESCRWTPWVGLVTRSALQEAHPRNRRSQSSSGSPMPPLRLAGTHGDVTRQAATADGSRQTVDDHALKVPAAVEAEHSGGPTRAEALEQTQTPPAGECSTFGRARPDDRVPQGPATPVHRHRHNAPRKLVASGFEADNKMGAGRPDRPPHSRGGTIGCPTPRRSSTAGLPGRRSGLCVRTRRGVVACSYEIFVRATPAASGISINYPWKS